MRTGRRPWWSTRVLGLDQLLVIVLGISLLPTAPANAPDVLAAPTHQLTGTWEALPAPPDREEFTVSDAVRLSDGRIAVVYSHGGTGNDECAAVYSPLSQTWELQEVAGPPDDWGSCLHSNEQFFFGPDGRLYGTAHVIDPSVEPWQVDFPPWRDEAFITIGITSSGNVYATHVFCDEICPETRLYELDMGTGDLTQVSQVPGSYHAFIGGADHSWLTIGGWDDENQARVLITYDPATDTWEPQPILPFNASWGRAKYGADGWLYAQATGSQGDLYARDPDTGDWLTVPLPDDVPDRWTPAFADSGDGRLYAMDRYAPYVFTPGAIEPIPTPEPAPIAPPGQGGATTPDQGGLLPDTATPDRNQGNLLAVGVLMGLVGAVAVAVVRRRYRAARVTPHR